MSFARFTAIAISATLTVGLVSLVAPAPLPEARELTSTVTAGANGLSVQPSEQSTSAGANAAAVTEPANVIVLPTPAPSVAEPGPQPQSAASLADTGPTSWAISIATRGYQDEIDQCLWVRMDLGGHAPIVGAHNYCGGGVVLEMHLGDVVTLAGTELDGTYLVSDARDARAGDIAATAIDGMSGRVILQTCYWGDGSAVRLVGLTPVPAP